jgi:hypothetical protein
MKLPTGKKAEANHLIWQYLETADRDYLEAAAILDAELVNEAKKSSLFGFEFGRGNRKIGDIDPALMEMARIILNAKLQSKPISIRSAALDVAHMIQGNSQSAKEQRLRREYTSRGMFFEFLAGNEVMNATVRQFAASIEGMSDTETALEVVRGIMALVGRHHASYCCKRFRANADSAARLLSADNRDAIDAAMRRWTKAARHAKRRAPEHVWARAENIVSNILAENKRRVTK